jgi:hypothetical protein
VAVQINKVKQSQLEKLRKINWQDLLAVLIQLQRTKRNVQL